MMAMGAKRALGTVLSTAVLLTATILTTTSASAECRAQRVYQATDEGKWASFDSLFVPPSTGPVTQTVRATRTHSSTVEVTAEMGMSAQAFVAEVNAKLGTSYSTTVTIETGRETSVTAPASTSRQEIRFGVFQQKISVHDEYYGCPSTNGAPNNVWYAYLPKEAAGVFVP